MKLNKLSFAVGNLFGAVAVGVLVTACGGGPSSSSSATAIQTVVEQPQAPQNYGTIQAKNIILAKGQNTQDRVIKIQANQLPSDVQVLASQVTVVNTTNTLQSTNLQAALDTELAVDFSTNIVGVWDVQNLSSEAKFKGTTGRVEFKTDGTYEVISGVFAVAGVVADGTTGYVTQPPYGYPEIIAGLHSCINTGARTYQTIDGVIEVAAGNAGTYVSILKNTTNSITIMGVSGAGCGSRPSVSRLTRVATPAGAAPASLKSVPVSSNIIRTSYKR